MAESLAKQAQTQLQLQPETSQRVGRRSCLPWTLTSSSWAGCIWVQEESSKACSV